MGWKGTVRSIGAASRRAQQASDRRSRALSRLHDKAGSVLAKLDAEIEKEIQRIERYEEKICTQPTKTLQLEYTAEAGWTTAPFREQTGQLTYTVSYTPPSQDVSFEPDAVDIGNIMLTPRAVSISQYFTAVAFDASTVGSAGGRVIKLTFPNKPEASRIVIASPAGEVFSPLDASLDGRLFPGTSREGIVTFEPFAEAVESFDVLIEVPAKDKAADSETRRIRITAETMREDMAACLGQPSILERMTEQFRSTQKQKHDEVTNKLKKASSGCMVVLTTALVAVLAVLAVLGWVVNATQH